MVGLGSMVDADACVAPLVDLGYSYWAEGTQPHHRLFVRFVDPTMTARTRNLHLIVARGQFWGEHLTFRNHLREHPETAAEYARLKRHLAATHRDGREAYTAAKSGFVSEILRRATRTP